MAEITDSTPQGGNEAEGTRMSRNARSRSLAVMLAAAGSLLVLAGTPVAASAATTSTAAPATLSPSGTYHFSVPANSVVTNAWGATVPDYRTGLVVGAGIVVSVTATGQWSYAPGKWVGPDGHYGSQGLTAQVTTNPDPRGYAVGSSHKWTVTSPRGELLLGRDTGNPNLATGSGSLSVTVTIWNPRATVNGFVVSNGTDPYSMVQRDAWAKIPGATVLRSGSTPLASLQPIGVDPGRGGTWTWIHWAIAPSAALLGQPRPLV